MINIVLFEPEIPQNTGNIIRTCMAANFKLHLIEPLGFSLSEKALRRSAMDYIKTADYQLYPDYATFLAQNPNENNHFYITRYSKQTYTDVKFPLPVYLIFGKESTGLPLDLLKGDLAHCLRIPMVPNARSLNLANSVALVSYEVLRQQDYLDLMKHESIKGEDWIYK